MTTYLFLPGQESHEEEKLTVENAEMCQRHRGSKLLHQNEQGAEYSSGYEDGWANPYFKKKTRRLFVTLEICNFAEIWGLGKGNIGQVPLTRWLGGASMGGVTLGGASVGRVTQGPRPASMKGKIPIWGEQTFIHIPWDGVTQHAMF